MYVLVATEAEVLGYDPDVGALRGVEGLEGERPTALSVDPLVAGRAWVGTDRGGLFRSDDAGASWQPVGLRGERILSVTADPVAVEGVWVGTEPSAVWHSGDGGRSWERTRALGELASSPEWAFPPRPDTHHVRWIASHPESEGRLWVAIEAGALVSTIDGGRCWRDRIPGGPVDTHEIAIHPDLPERHCVAAGDGYFESPDCGMHWERPRDGLEIRYLRSIAIDPGRADIIVVSGASHAHAAYVAGRSDGRVYRREGEGDWVRVTDGWPDPPETIAPLLRPGLAQGEFWAADERGLHRSEDGGISWRLAAPFPSPVRNLRGLGAGE